MVERAKNESNEVRMLDVDGLCSYLSLGRSKAVEFAKSVKACKKFGRRTLFDKTIIDRALNDMDE